MHKLSIWQLSNINCETQRRFDSMAYWRDSSSKRYHYQEDSAYNWGSKRRNLGYDADPNVPGLEDTVYRYLCPSRKIGGIIGVGGRTVKQLRADTLAKIKIGNNVPGCDERVITIFSSISETSAFGDDDDYVCRAQAALFRVHEKLAGYELQGDEDKELDAPQVTVRLLVLSDQIGCVIGTGGRIIQGICIDTGAQIRILRDGHLPFCAVRSDGLIQITGEALAVKKALFQVSYRLHKYPSQLQHLLFSDITHFCKPGGQYRGPNGGERVMSMGGHGEHIGDTITEQPRTYPPKDETSAREFMLCLLCPSVNIGQVIGKGGEILNQIRQDSGAFIKVDSSYDDDDCTISISAKEFFEEPISPAITAAVHLQPGCSEKTEKESGEPSYTTRLLVSAREVGCLIGLGGSKISEMKRATRANIRIHKTDLPKAASDYDAMVQISGDNDAVRDALVQVTARLRANLFGREDALSSILSAVYHSMPRDVHGHGCSYSAECGTSG